MRVQLKKTEKLVQHCPAISRQEKHLRKLVRKQEEKKTSFFKYQFGKKRILLIIEFDCFYSYPLLNFTSFPLLH